MILVKKEKSAKGHWAGFEPGTNVGYVVSGKLAKSPEEALDVIKNANFDRESEQVNEDNGEIRITRWYGEFFDASQFVSGDVTEVRGRKATASKIKVTYVD